MKHLTPEHREKIRLSLLGNKHLLGKRGPDAIGWKGGITYNSQGYRLIYNPDSSMANSVGYVGEHRLVMAGVIGRPLRSDEHVHHIDGNRINNVPSNLRIMSCQEHARERWLVLLNELDDLRRKLAEKEAVITGLEAQLADMEKR